MPDKSDATNLELPTVTIFGAGIAGLTAAHELIERGFPVQVVENQQSQFEEYDCAVGGLAANQFSRVRAPIPDLHPWLLVDAQKDNLNRALRFRGAISLEQTGERFPLLQAIRFDKNAYILKPDPAGSAPPSYDAVPPSRLEPQDPVPPRDWRNYWDHHGTTNSYKLSAVLETIRKAARYYMNLYFPHLAEQIALGEEPTTIVGWGNISPIFDTVENACNFVARETLLVRIIGYTDGDGTADGNRAIAFDWATKVQEELIRLNNDGPADLKIWQFWRQLEIVVRGSADPRYDQSDPLGRSISNRVEFEILEQVIPGEHGFRFFPAFYRHVFDTMRRTPILDASDGTAPTTFDQLVPTPHPTLALDDGMGPQNFDFRHLASIQDFEAAVSLLCDRIGFTPQDLMGLQFYTLRYLTSGAKRRLGEAEPINLLTYIGGHKPEGRFSAAALDFINNAPRALAAMSATESDARTQFDVTAQLMNFDPSTEAIDDMTLNGPTSTVWFDYWKAYLKAQGVKFFVGKITALREFEWALCSGVHRARPSA